MDYKQAIEQLYDLRTYCGEQAIDGVVDWKRDAQSLDLAIKALEKQAFFENKVNCIRDWFVDNKECLLDAAQTVGRDGFIASSTNNVIDEVDFDFIIEDIVNEIQKGILNVLDTFMKK
jgi:hypothetical protein